MIDENNGYLKLAKDIAYSGIIDLRELLAKPHSSFKKKRQIAFNYFFYIDGKFEDIKWYDISGLGFLERFFNKEEMNEMKRIGELFELKKDNIKDGWCFQRLNQKLYYVKIDNWCIPVNKECKMSFIEFLKSHKIESCWNRDGSLRKWLVDSVDDLYSDNIKVNKVFRKLRDSVNSHGYANGGLVCAIIGDETRYFYKTGAYCYECYFNQRDRWIRFDDIEDKVEALWDVTGKLIWSTTIQVYK